MPSSIKRISPVLIELDITVPRAEIAAAADKAYAKLAREVRVRGFRKGKAPRGVLRRLFGDAVLSEVRGELVPRAFVQALAENDLQPLGEPELDFDQIVEEDGGFHFTAKVEVAPQLERIDWEGVELRRRPTTPDDEEVDRELERLRRSQAAAVDLDEPRPARAGDLVTVDLKRWQDGEWRDSAQGQEIPLDPVDGTPEPLLEALEGAEPGEEKVIDFGESEEGRERVRFMAKVTAVRERCLPELDDELAKDLGDFETREELRRDVVKKMKETREESQRDGLQRQLLDELAEKNEMELPENVVQRQTEAMRQELGRVLGGLDEQSGDDEQDEQQAEMMRTMQEGSEQRAREMVQRHFLVREIARHADIEVSDDDVESEVSRIAEKSGAPAPKIRAELGHGDQRARLEMRILEDKVFEYALGKVKILEVEDDEEEETSESDEAGDRPDTEQ
ncbi:MAG: trigger factor [Polyangia bacterium]